LTKQQKKKTENKNEKIKIINFLNKIRLKKK